MSVKGIVLVNICSLFNLKFSTAVTFASHALPPATGHSIVSNPRPLRTPVGLRKTFKDYLI